MNLREKINNPYLLLLALSMTGCELIGPKMNDKIPIAQQQPLPEQSGVPIDNDQSQKTAKTEIFEENTASLYLPKLNKTQAPKNQRGMYSFQFNEADISEVAKTILGDTLQRNYIISPQVSGKVTLNTSDPVSREELIPMLEMLLSNYNAVLVEQNGVFQVRPSSEGAYSSKVQTLGHMQIGFQTQIVPVRNVSASELAEVLKPLLPDKSLLQVEPRQNLLLVAAAGTDIGRVLDVVHTFDVDVLKGRSFALFTPAHVNAAKIIQELEPIFNPKSVKGFAGGQASNQNSGGNGNAKDSASNNESDHAFFHFIEIERLNAILAITHNPKYLHDIERWVQRLDKVDGEASGGVHVYRAQHVNSIDLAATLNDIYGNGGRNGSGASVASGRKPLSLSNSSGFGSSGSSGSGTLGGLSSSSPSSTGTLGGTTNSSFGSSGTGLDRGLNNRSASQSNATGSGGGGNNGNALMPSVRIVADEGNNAVIIIASAEEYASVLKVIKQLDVLPQQVLIDATIVEVTLNNDLNYGVEWYLTHNHNTVGLGGGGSNALNVSQIATGVTTGGFSYAFQSMPKDLNFLLQSEATNNNINVVSSPSLMVLNNQEASITVGDSVPIRSSVSTNLSAGTTTPIQTSSIQMVDTGVNLIVRPHVNSSGLVLMDILQKVDNAVTTTTSSSIDSPTIQKREITTSAVVQSGETIVLGGLIKEENDNNVSGIPWFGQLPVIGPLFSTTARNKDRTELIVLLTPRVVNSRQNAREITDEFRQKLSTIYEKKQTMTLPMN
jgi:general secretion pathway protein D